jgi:hypothetical protein
MAHTPQLKTECHLQYVRMVGAKRVLFEVVYFAKLSPEVVRADGTVDGEAAMAQLSGHARAALVPAGCQSMTIKKFGYPAAPAGITYGMYVYTESQWTAEDTEAFTGAEQDIGDSEGYAGVVYSCDLNVYLPLRKRQPNPDPVQRHGVWLSPMYDHEVLDLVRRRGMQRLISDAENEEDEDMVTCRLDVYGCDLATPDFLAVVNSILVRTSRDGEGDYAVVPVLNVCVRNGDPEARRRVRWGRLISGDLARLCNFYRPGDPDMGLQLDVFLYRNFAAGPGPAPPAVQAAPCELRSEYESELAVEWRAVLQHMFASAA